MVNFLESLTIVDILAIGSYLGCVLYCVGYFANLFFNRFGEWLLLRLTEEEFTPTRPVSEMPQLPYCDKCCVHFDFDSCELVEDEGHSYFFCPNCSYLMRVK